MYRIIACLIFIASLVLLHFFLQNIAFPNTSVAKLDVSWKSKAEIKRLLQEQDKRSIELVVRDRHYKLPLSNLGVSLGVEGTITRVFSENSKPFPHNALAFMKSFNTKKSYYPSLQFDDTFHTRLQQFVFDFSEQKDEIIFSGQDTAFSYIDHQQKFRLDTPLLQIAIMKRFGDDSLVFEPKLHKIFHNPTSAKVYEYNNQLAQVYKEPVRITVSELQRQHEIVLSEKEIKSVLGASVQPGAERITLLVNEQQLEKVLKEKTIRPDDPDKGLNLTTVKQSVLSLLHSRFSGVKINTVSAQTSLVPNTDGSVAEKYIEVDISQQKMYLWENGKTVAVHTVSTGLYYPTPTGKFKILNKATNAFSDIFNVWMPYWMAIYYDPKVEAFIGIHELPYWYSGNNIVRRPREFLGTPRTGGCISLDVGVAKEVQDWSEIGMPVHVYQ